jgi:hypothetical protein
MNYPRVATPDGCLANLIQVRGKKHGPRAPQPKEEIMFWRSTAMAVLLALAAAGCRHMSDPKQPIPPKEQVQEPKATTEESAEKKEVVEPAASSEKAAIGEPAATEGQSAAPADPSDKNAAEGTETPAAEQP